MRPVHWRHGGLGFGSNESHDGASAFTVCVSFSDDIDARRSEMKGVATVTGGLVNRARNVDGDASLWETKVSVCMPTMKSPRPPATPVSVSPTARAPFHYHALPKPLSASRAPFRPSRCGALARPH